MITRRGDTKHLVAATVAGMIAAFLFAGGTTPKVAAQSHSASGQSSVPILARLATSLDSKKRKSGDAVELKTTAAAHLGDMTIPSGAKIIGHITDAKARAKGDGESSLGITFDKIEVKGKTVAISGVIRAVGPNLNEQSGNVDYGNSMNQATQHSAGGAGATPVQPLTEQSEGVMGIKDVKLTSDGTLHSDGKVVKVDSDAQVLIVATMGEN